MTVRLKKFYPLLLAAALSLLGCGGGSSDKMGSIEYEPNVKILSSAVDGVGNDFDVSFLFDAPISFYGEMLPFSLAGGNVRSNSFKKISPTMYQVTIEPHKDNVGTIQLVLSPGSFYSESGTVANSRSNTYTVQYNTTLPRPHLSFGGAVDVLGFIIDHGTFVVEFDVTLDYELKKDKIHLSVGDIVDFTKISTKGAPDAYQFSISLPYDYRGPILFDINEGAVSHLGRPNRKTWSSFYIDRWYPILEHLPGNIWELSDATF